MRSLEYLPLDGIAEADRNPKRHDQETLGKSISRFGYVEPLVLDERTGRLVAGHGRLEQLRRRQKDGEAPPPGVEVDADGQWLAPVVRGWGSSDDAEAEGYLLASNRVTQLGGWDTDILADILQGQPDLSGIGWDDRELRTLLAETGRLAQEVAGFLDDVDVDVPGSRPITTQGEWATLSVTLPRDVRADVIRRLQLIKASLGTATVAEAFVEVIRRFPLDATEA